MFARLISCCQIPDEHRSFKFQVYILEYYFSYELKWECEKGMRMFLGFVQGLG